MNEGRSIPRSFSFASQIESFVSVWERSAGRHHSATTPATTGEPKHLFVPSVAASVVDEDHLAGYSQRVEHGL
jgi:hypothetical protein